MPDDVFKLPSTRELLEIIFQVLFTHSAGDANAAEKIWKEYMQYRTRWQRECDTEDSFIVGVIMLALDDFTSARTALWHAVLKLNLQHESSKITAAQGSGESNPVDEMEYAKSFIKYSKYLVMAHLTPLRESPNEAEKEISPEDLERLTRLLEHVKLADRFGNYPKFLLAQAYEASSIRACVNRTLDNRTRETKVTEYFQKAHGHYYEYGEIPEEFNEWKIHLQKSNFCY